VQRTARDAELVLDCALFEGAGRTIRLSAAGIAVARWSHLALNELANAGSGAA
jgi:DNA-binding transcriptional LysR family regulator